MGLDRPAAYVALTRHRDGVELHFGADQFRDARELARVLGRERAKDTTLDYGGQDYGRTFAERRGDLPPGAPSAADQGAGSARVRRSGARAEGERV